MNDIDRFVCSELCQGIAAPGRGGQEGPVSYSFTACVRCTVPQERLLGGERPRPRPPTIRVEARPGDGGILRR